MIELSGRQQEVLDFIRVFRRKNRYSPTRLEIATEMGFNVNAAQDHVKALKRKGYITYAPRISRSIRVLKR